MNRFELALVALIGLLAGACLFQVSRKQDASDRWASSSERASGFDSLGRVGTAAQTGDRTAHGKRIDRGYAVDLELRIPAGAAREVYAELKPRAEAGDYGATVSLYLKMAGCWRAQGRDGDVGPATASPGRDALRVNDECEGFNDEQLTTSANLLERAAAAGQVQAQMLYAGNLGEMFSGSTSEAFKNAERIVKFKRNVINYLTASAATGSVDAMVELAHIYRHGRFGTRNFAESYAYFYAANKAAPASEAVSSRYGRGAEFEEGLTTEQLQQGRTQGEAIYRACCAR